MAKAKPISNLDCLAATGTNARALARVRLEDLYDWGQYVGSPYASKELHNLRIAAKRLRYTLELFEDALPVSCKLIVKELEQIQEELGGLHDCDVLIALLRLCLSAQDSGSAYAHALYSLQGRRVKTKLLFPPALVVSLLDPSAEPSAEERYGLEQLLLRQQGLRKERYEVFRRHWYVLQARDFRHEILHSLDV